MRIGSRGSELALVQARAVADAIGGAEVIAVETDDSAVGDKARFVRGVEQALLDGRVDLAVHSAKDLPAERPSGVALAGVPRREDPADVLVGAAASLRELRPEARVGTASLRRRSQLLALRPDLELAELRGNVDTRLRRQADGDFDAIVLAAAGLARLGRLAEHSFRFAVEELTPAAGQGSLAIEVRAEDEAAAAAAAAITDRDALIELSAERAAVAALGASCETPVGLLARHRDGELELRGYAGLPDGSEWVRDRLSGDPERAVALGESLAERMLAAGAGEILERAAELGG